MGRLDRERFKDSIAKAMAIVIILVMIFNYWIIKYDFEVLKPELDRVKEAENKIEILRNQVNQLSFLVESFENPHL